MEVEIHEIDLRMRNENRVKTTA